MAVQLRDQRVQRVFLRTLERDNQWLAEYTEIMDDLQNTRTGQGVVEVRTQPCVVLSLARLTLW